jgi:hypothetical protein
VKGIRIAGLGKYRNLAIASFIVVGAGMTTAGIASPDGHFAAAAAAAVTPFSVDSTRVATAPSASLSARVAAAVQTLSAFVKQSSHSEAITSAVRSYFAFQQARPGEVKKPYLYFVDFGLPGNTPRGYVFDMSDLSLLDGPFMVAHGRGSAASGSVVPSTFSNANGSAATSLGLYVAEELYAFSGKAGGRTYTSVGMRMTGVSASYNDNARARGVVAHGAPYVTPSGAGRSEGCPAVDQARASRLLPMLSNGALVFLFAPESDWLERDPWVTAVTE